MQLTKINGKYELILPKHRAEREQWDINNGGWEVGRIDAMINTIKPTDIVLDIGTELGDISAIIAKYTDCNIILCEPNSKAYPAIKCIWEANNLKKPLDFFRGFISNKSTLTEYKINNTFDGIDVNDMISGHGFLQMYEDYPEVTHLTLDDYCELSGLYPDVITMDVEGFEQHLVRYGEKLLREKKPIIFMSVHPEFMYESYRNEGKWKEMYGEKQHVVHLLRFIDELGYRHECLEYDYHELHMKFIPI